MTNAHAPASKGVIVFELQIILGGIIALGIVEILVLTAVAMFALAGLMWIASRPWRGWGLPPITRVHDAPFVYRWSAQQGEA